MSPLAFGEIISFFPTYPNFCQCNLFQVGPTKNQEFFGATRFWGGRVLIWMLSVQWVNTIHSTFLYRIQDLKWMKGIFPENNRSSIEENSSANWVKFSSMVGGTCLTVSRVLNFTICLIHRRQYEQPAGQAADFISVGGRRKLWVLPLIIFENVGLTQRQDDPQNK